MIQPINQQILQEGKLTLNDHPSNLLIYKHKETMLILFLSSTHFITTIFFVLVNSLNKLCNLISNKVKLFQGTATIVDPVISSPIIKTIRPIEPLPPCLSGEVCQPCIGCRSPCSCRDFTRPFCCGQCPICPTKKPVFCLDVMCPEPF